MENIIDLIATDSSPAEITDKIKDALYSKTSSRIENIRPEVANSMFFNNQEEEE